jgi:hypothetical protein
MSDDQQFYPQMITFYAEQPPEIIAENREKQQEREAFFLRNPDLALIRELYREMFVEAFIEDLAHNAIDFEYYDALGAYDDMFLGNYQVISQSILAADGRPIYTVQLREGLVECKGHRIADNSSYQKIWMVCGCEKCHGSVGFCEHTVATWLSNKRMQEMLIKPAKR